MANKYINAEKLKAEIKRLTNQKKEKLKRFSDEDYTCSVASSINCKLQGNEEVLSLIDSLQQEQLKLYKDESLGSPDYERGFKHGRDYQTEVTRKYTNKDKVIAYLVDKGYPVSTNGEIPTYQEIFDMINNAIKHANKHEQPEAISIKVYLNRDISGQLIISLSPNYRDDEWMLLDSKLFPNIKCGDAPRCVNIIIKEIK